MSQYALNLVAMILTLALTVALWAVSGLVASGDLPIGDWSPAVSEVETTPTSTHKQDEQNAIPLRKSQRLLNEMMTSVHSGRIGDPKSRDDGAVDVE